MTYKATILIVAASVTVLAACSTYKPMPRAGTQGYRDTLVVVIQICMPTIYVNDHLWVSEVYRYGTYGEMRAYGGSAVGVKKVGLSSAGQPIFEKFFQKRQMDLLNIMVNVDQTKYVYDLKQVELSTEEWTKWGQPLSQNFRSDMVGYQLANHRELKIREPNEQAPRIRYRLVRMSDWKAPRSSDNLDGCDLY